MTMKVVSLYGFTVNRLAAGHYRMRAKGGNGVRKTLEIKHSGDWWFVEGYGKYVTARDAFNAANKELNPGKLTKRQDPTRPLPAQPEQ